MTVIKPLTVATIGKHPLRFFRPPNDVADFPWHAIDDLHRCLGLNRQQRRVFLCKLQTKNIQTVATPDGIVSIAPHYMAQGTIDAMVEEGMAPARIRAEYDDAGAEALRKLIPAHLTFPSDAWMAWMKAAWHRHDAKAG
jgi:hypothetical protein